MRLWKTKNFFLEIFFPSFCVNCQVEGTFLCQDCQSLINLRRYHPKKPYGELKELYFASSYQDQLVQKLITSFKYPPFIKSLAEPLSSLILTHLQLLDNRPDFSEFLLVPVPLHKKKLKWRGFNQAEEIGKFVSRSLEIPLLNHVLIKIKQTPAQTELSGSARRKNIKGAFICQDPKPIKNQKILLIDDVATTGATIQECGRVLKAAGAKKVIGMVVARELPERRG